MEQKEKVILFGRGMVYQRKKESLYRRYEVIAILDNAVKPGDPIYPSIEHREIVMNPADLGKFPDMLQDPDVPVILLSYALGDMSGQLRELGVPAKRFRFGPEIGPYNTFERMLFGNGGELIWEEGDIFYRNREHRLDMKIDPSDLEKLAESLKDTPLYPKADGILQNLPQVPLDDTYGMCRGTPVDRYYIEAFLDLQKERIGGKVMEIGDRAYTERFGGEKVTESVILHVEREAPKINQIKGDLSTGEGIEAESVDCLICTQTLPFIYDVRSAVCQIVKLLKRGGTALITAAGISQIIQYEMIHYGHFWSFTEQSMRRLFEGIAEVESVDVFTYGNVKASAAFLYGISSEELSREDLEFHDPNYQLIVAAVIRKK